MTKVKGERQRRLAPNGTRGGLTPEQKEFILACLVCCQPYWEIKEEFEEEFDRKAPTPQTVSDYRIRYAEEIERRREEWRANLKSSGIPFVDQHERVKQYARFARIEIRRKRYKEAREHMHEIALETGDLKERREITGKDGGPVEFRSVPDAELDQSIAARLEDLARSGNQAADPGTA